MPHRDILERGQSSDAARGHGAPLPGAPGPLPNQTKRKNEKERKERAIESEWGGATSSAKINVSVI